jgi:predicted SnoaL-like aldol condensation-catalyzing enzyme
MKLLQSVISATLAITIAFAACTNDASDKKTTGNTDTAAATSVNAVDANQQKLEANKKLVTDFYQSLFGDKDSTALDKYITDNFIQHNPSMQDGREWLKNALRPFLSNPNVDKTKVDIKHIAADGDMVWLYVRDVAPNGKVFARVDIFRIENGKIAENWKISEPVPAKSENKNSMF